jgi:hypothetical protein
MAHPYWSLGNLPRQKPYFKERIKIGEMVIHNEQNPDPRSHPMDMGSSEEE